MDHKLGTRRGGSQARLTRGLFCVCGSFKLPKISGIVLWNGLITKQRRRGKNKLMKYSTLLVATFNLGASPGHLKSQCHGQVLILAIIYIYIK